jgi:beta-galactosidase
MSISNQAEQRRTGRKAFQAVQASVKEAGFAFTHDVRDFLIDGRPVQVFSGEVHYFRVPRPYWRDRLMKAKALGLNTVCTYMPWNLHEPRPGEFDFEGDGGMLDVAGFVQLARQLGLMVIVRPGPYICAEWDFGGLPGWLLADADSRVRCADGKYLSAVGRYVARVGEELAGLTCGSGGPIVMVQVENEYGSYSNDKVYLTKLREMLRDGGLGESNGVLLFTSDGTDHNMLAGGTLGDCLAVANFGSKAEEQLGKLKAFRGGQPLMCGEYWCGWFDQWGKRRQGTADTSVTEGDVRWMAGNNASFNIYMFHGGTNFGFTSGANWYDGYAATVTGYDYCALLDEAGRPAAKYHAVREVLKGHVAGALPEVPVQAVPVVAIGAERFRYEGAAGLMENLPAGVRDAAVRPMEHYGQYGGGAVLYRTDVTGLEGGKLTVVEPRDYAIVYLDGRRVGTLDRRMKERTIEIPSGGRRLEILVWALGRINYGHHLMDRKGITDRVELGLLTLSGWEVFTMPMGARDVEGLSYGREAVDGPAFHRFSVELGEGEVGDTFLDLRAWGMGAVWVNGHALGRYWNVGPQQTLYCPGCWLKEGRNEVVVLDLNGDGEKVIAGLREPILDEVR